MPDAQDPWELEELIPFNEGDITVVDSYFEEGKFGTQLVWTCRVDVPRNPVDFPAETFNGWYSVGKGWAVLEAGARISKPEADPTRIPKIHASSNYGKIIARVVDLGVNMRERGAPTQASVWKDMRFTMKREQVKYTGLPTAEGGTIDRDASILLPTALLPALGAAAPTPISPAVAAAPAATAPAAPAAVPIEAPLDGTPEAHVLSLVLGKSSLAEAKAAAIKDEVVAANDSLGAQILEQQLLERWFDSGVLVMADGRIARSTA